MKAITAGPAVTPKPRKETPGACHSRTHSAVPEPSDSPPLSVWATAQNGPRAQRRGRYLPESDAHPAKMFPAIAAHAIAAYTSPGDLVVDPMCGIGTTLVEAMHADRMAIGVEYEKRWADLAARNVEYAVDRGAPATPPSCAATPATSNDLSGCDVHGKAALVLTSPPYGPATHGHVRSAGTPGSPACRSGTTPTATTRTTSPRRACRS